MTQKGRNFMSLQEINKLLEDLLQEVEVIRLHQLQFLAESNRENKFIYREKADTAWKQFKAIHQQLTETFRQAEVAQNK